MFNANVNLKKNCEFMMYGPGVEKVFEECKKIFPDKNIKIFQAII